MGAKERKAKPRGKASAPVDPRSQLPAVAVLLGEPAVQALLAAHPRPLVVDAVRAALEGLRREAAKAKRAPDRAQVLERVRAELAREEADRPRPVVNATGILLHTGLGRAVLPDEAAAALGRLNRCCNMQLDLETGARGKRNAATEKLLCRLTGAEAAALVNNNAAATMLILAALCPGREVVISRGQLIEIGGSFRLPDCIHQSGAIMVEVGTTNKTHLRDYEAALSENTGMLLRVNPSNYRVVGFHKEVSTAELVTLKAQQDVIVVDDLGCGALVDLSQYGLPKEPTVQDSIAAGADLACFSGDKLIGGPQAGIIVGRKDLVAKIKKHPLTRMMRVCKLTDTALEHTLRLFLEPEKLLETNPTLRSIAAPVEEMKKRAQSLKRRLDKLNLPLQVKAIAGESATGGGSLPATPIPTWLLAVSADALSTDELCRRLRQHEPPVIARVANDEVLLDTRTLLDGDEKVVLAALKKVCA
jgi:L-seryl-tRNA(Ser) seleniumtransferase